MHLKTGAAKVDYKITIEKVLKLPDTKGLLRIEWKRTSDSGKTKAVAAANKEVTFHETIEFTSNLFTEADNLAQKLMQFHLKEKDGSKGVSHGKVTLNLAAHVDLSNKYDKHEVTVELPLHPNSPNGAVLQIHVWSQPIALKHGKKKVKKNSNGDWVEDNSTTSGSFEVSEDGSKSEGEEKKHRRSLSRKLSIGGKDKKEKSRSKDEKSTEERGDKEKQNDTENKKDKSDKSEKSKDKKEKSKRSEAGVEKSKEEKRKEKSERKEEKSKDKQLRKENKRKEKESRSEKEEEKKHARRAEKEKKESEKKSKVDKHSKKPRIPKEGDDHSGSQQDSASVEGNAVKGETKTEESASVSVDESRSTDDEVKKKEKEERRRLRKERKEREEREKKEKEEKEKRERQEKKEAKEKAKRDKRESKSEKSTEASLSESGEGEKKESRSKSLLRKLTASSSDKPDLAPVMEKIAPPELSKPESVVAVSTPLSTTTITNSAALATPEPKTTPIISTTVILPSEPSSTVDDKASKKERKKKEKEAKKEKKRIEKENASHQSASVDSSVDTSEVSESESSFSASEGGGEKRSADKQKKSSRLNKLAHRLSISRVDRPHEAGEKDVARGAEKTPEGTPNKSGSSAQLEIPSKSDVIGEKKVESRETVKKGSSLQEFLNLTKPRQSEGRKDKESKKDIDIKLTSEKTEELPKAASSEQVSPKSPSQRIAESEKVVTAIVQPEPLPTNEKVVRENAAAQLASEKELESEREKARALKEKKRLAKKELEEQQLTNALNALKHEEEQHRKEAEIAKEKRKAKAKAKEIEKQKANLEKSAAVEKQKMSEQLREIVLEESCQNSGEKRSVDIDSLDIAGARDSESVEDMSARIKEKLSKARNRVSEFDSRNSPTEKRKSVSSSTSSEQGKPKKPIEEEEVEVVDYVISGSEATLSSDSDISSSEEERIEKKQASTNASSSTSNNSSSVACLFDIDKAYPDEKPSDYLFKMILIGDSGVGKSSLMRRWMHNSFGPTSVTVNVECYCKTFPLNDQNVTFHFWDTAGQEKFRSITNTYYRGSHGIMLVYDIENESSFQNIQRWVNDIEPHFPEKPPIMLLIGNKSDTDKRKVTTENGLKLAASLQMFFIETSAKTGEECRRAFAILMEEIFNTNHEYEKELRSSDRKSRTATSSQIIKVEENSLPVGKVTKKSCSCSQ